MKKVVVIGTGAQGTAVARRLDEEPAVSEIVCADHDEAAVHELAGSLRKATGVKCDARDVNSIVECARGADLIVNALPLEFGRNVLDAALEVRSDYQDFASSTAFDEEEGMGWVRGMKYQFDIYGPKFRDIGRLAMIGTGSAPGLICCATRDAMKYLDTCDTIYNMVWEGVESRRFQPFWWSPETAIQDMQQKPYIFEDGRIFEGEPFEDPVTRKYDYMSRAVTFLNHCHDEPVQYGLNAEKYFKGCRNAYFKYAGAGMDFAYPLYRAGLLSHEEINVNGNMVAPFDVVVSCMPQPPRFYSEIKQIIDEGLVSDEGCMAVEAYGKKDGRRILVENHVMAPGFAESFRKAGMTAEMYLTGQGGFLFSKMLVSGDIAATGLISSDMLPQESVDKYFEYARKLDIRLETKVTELE